MKVLDAILMADKLRDNAIDREQKLVWLNELELKIQSRILRTAPDDMIEYDLNNDEATEMLVPRPFDKVYYLWLCAMIDYGNAEFDKYQNDMAMANAAYDDYAKWFMRLFHSDPQNVLYIGGTTKYGLSAYQIACNHGFVGTEAEWVESLHGKDAYTAAVEYGYAGTEEEFNAQLGALAELEEIVRVSAEAASSDAAKAEKAKSSAAESEGNAKAYAEGGTVQKTTYDESGHVTGITATEVTGAKRYQEYAAGHATRSVQAMTRAAAYAEGGTAPSALIGNVVYPEIDTIGAKGYMEQAQAAAESAGSEKDAAEAARAAAEAAESGAIAAKNAAEAAVLNGPKIENNTWWVYDAAKQTYVDTGVDASGLAGQQGERGTGLLKVSTAPSSYTTAIGDYTPKYRIALDTVIAESGADKVLVGDVIERLYYHYVIDYLDETYAYSSVTRTSIRGATGATGARGVGVRDVLPVAESSESGGTNTFRVRLTNGDYTNFNYRNGKDGGYYDPEVTQPSENMMRLTYFPSQEGMGDIKVKNIVLPQGPKGEKGDKGDPAGGGEWRQIAFIELTEPVTSIVIEQDSNEKPFNLSQIAVDAYFFANETNEQVNTTFWCLFGGGNETRIIADLPNNKSTSRGFKGMGIVGADGLKCITTTSGFAGNGLNPFNASNKTISFVKFECKTSGNAFGAGSIISIWGVDA